MVFFRKYLGDLVRESGNATPLPVPSMYTVNDFFYKISHAQVTDKLNLLLELYSVYRSINPQAESLDEFIYWGEVMLSDFDDIDKYLVSPSDILQNVSDIKSLEDNFDYLSDNQRSAINSFLSHFRDGKESLSISEGSVKYKFLRIWNQIYPIYTQFNARLQEKGMSYEGMVYRSVAGRLKEGASVVDILHAELPEVEAYVFVGLNALNECERLLLKKMRDAGLASFVWDFESQEIRNKENKSSFFMRRNLEDFPQAFPLESIGTKKPEITVISVPSAIGETKLAPQILQQIKGDPVETAFVLPDESLLLPLLNSIPEGQDSINVTMGYPMSSSAVFTLLHALGQMQLKMRNKGDVNYFYHRQVREVFSSGILRKLLSQDEQEQIRKIKADAKYYIPASDFAGPVLKLLFRPVITEPTVASAKQNHATEQYFADIVTLIGQRLAIDGQMLLELDFAKRCLSQLNILQGVDLEVLPGTHFRMLERLFEGISVPFKGEPLKGLQIMGPLETRALDFKNLVILSANEGVFPRRSVSSSFIPPQLRKGFGLPTYEYQDAVWAYYFYRMIQRPEKIWLIYDSRTEGLKSGEESRYIKQLEYHFGFELKRKVASAALCTVPPKNIIPKTQEHVDAIRARELSASALQNYLTCQAKFYYQIVENLQVEDDVAESLDSGMLGNAFHHVMQRLYSKKLLVTAADLDAMIKDKAGLRRMIREEVLAELRSIEVSGRNLVLEKVLLDYVLSVLKHDASLLKSTGGSEGFRIIGLEQKMKTKWEGFRFKGYIDRIDSYKDGEVRIVDYKTGKVEDDDILITDDNAAEVVEKLFGESNKGRPKIALQLFMYDLFAHADPSLKDRPIVNSIYSTGRLYTGPLPDMPESPAFTGLVKERLKIMLDEMVNLEVPFKLTTESKTCEWCDFKAICGR